MIPVEGARARWLIGAARKRALLCPGARNVNTFERKYTLDRGG